MVETVEVTQNDIYSELKIRTMDIKELKLAMSWASKEGWNPGKYDYLSYYAQDPTGFLVLLINQEPVGSISIVKYDNRFAFIGLFIVKPEYRNQGYGKKLWEAALDRLSEYSSIVLYSVPQQKTRYENSGFLSQYLTQRWQMDERFSPSRQEIQDQNLLPIQEDTDAYSKLIKYDKKKWGSSRSSFFRVLLEQEESYIFISLDETTGKINGYGTVRPCEIGFRIGPLYSDSFPSAQKLAEHLILMLPERSRVIFDIPNKNIFASLFAEYFNLSHISEVDTEAMFKGGYSDTHPELCYGVSSLEIG